jgi:hypothetical protein
VLLRQSLANAYTKSLVCLGAVCSDERAILQIRRVELLCIDQSHTRLVHQLASQLHASGRRRDRELEEEKSACPSEPRIRWPPLRLVALQGRQMVLRSAELLSFSGSLSKLLRLGVGHCDPVMRQRIIRLLPRIVGTRNLACYG